MPRPEYRAPPGIRHPKQWTFLLDALDHDRAQLTHKRATHYLYVARVLGLVERVKRNKRPDLYRLNGRH